MAPTAAPPCPKSSAEALTAGPPGYAARGTPRPMKSPESEFTLSDVTVAPAASPSSTARAAMATTSSRRMRTEYPQTRARTRRRRARPVNGGRSAVVFAAVECSNCGAANAADQNFCGSCGRALLATCSTCGAANPPGHRFCGQCGSALSGGSAASPAPQVPVAERRLVTVLFADLVGFTAASEGRDAEDTRELLSRYFELANTLIARYGGTVEKFIGDAVMAVWGAPV